MYTYIYVFSTKPPKKKGLCDQFLIFKNRLSSRDCEGKKIQTSKQRINLAHQPRKCSLFYSTEQANFIN